MQIVLPINRNLVFFVLMSIALFVVLMSVEFEGKNSRGTQSLFLFL